MTDIPKQIDYWVKTAKEDFEVGQNLVNQSKIRHGLFFINLSIEKMLKACYCKKQNNTPPKIHNLPRLYEMSGLEIFPEQQSNLAALNRFCLEGRYPEEWPVTPDQKEAERYIQMSQKVIEWLKQQL